MVDPPSPFGTTRYGGPLVIVSNRLPVVLSRRARGLEHKRAPGGLVSALEPALQRHGGRWVGWPGIALRAGERIETGDAGYEIHPVNLSEAEVNRYYHGFSNRTLWPLFHCLPGRAHFEPNEWTMYERVNARFADAAAACAGDGELVWVHDYQLMLVPFALRAAHAQSRIAFFLHVPFPPYDLFRLLPWDRELLRGLLAADLIGFHVEGYVRNFLDCCERLLGARVDRESHLVEHGDRTVRVAAFPIGIDFEFFASRARAAPPSHGAERIVLGVDRLDYTKGLPERIRAVERLLELHPEHREKITFLQIAVPSRVQVAEYHQQKRQIDELVGRVNGRFATADWSPIRYLYRSFSPERLAALYRDADVAVVTPLRDGMNLVAKEFVACQVGRPGVLVLSRLAGAAETMQEAILVNPYNLDATAEALHRALTMDEEERRSRLVALRRRERRAQVSAWLDEFLSAAAAVPAALQPPSDRDFEAWLGPLLGDYRIALFLDYDGTLVRLCDDPNAAVLTPPMQRALVACVRREDIDVAIVSGRALADVTAMVSRPEITYAANHGLEIAGPGLAPFRHPDLVHFEARIDELAAALRPIAAKGAWVEAKGATLTFHYRTVERSQQARLAEQARSLITQAGFQARDAHCAVEARPPIAWDKGQAVYHILRGRYGPTWSEVVRVVYVGDDQTDEDAFRILAGLGMTFRIGSADTLTGASRRLPNVDAVQALLAWLAARPGDAVT
jgi:trehalose 6-phosphate synthase/phosphatase